MVAKVGIVKSEIPNLKKLLDLIKFKPGSYDFVAIKPNLCAGLPYYSGATTDLRLIEEVIKTFKDCAGQVAVIESNGFTDTAEQIADKTGVKDVCDYFEIPFINLSKDILIPIKGDLKALKGVKIPRTFLKADFLVNLPVMKTHSITTVSLGMKNMLGILPDKKSSYHSKLSEAINDIHRIRKPDMTIMDGLIGMDGEGPISGSPKKMDLLLASEDVLALDITTCRVMRINPTQVDHLQKAAYYGLGEGNPSNIKVLGEKVEDVWDRFFT